MSKLSECKRKVYASGLFTSNEDDGLPVSGISISSITCKIYTKRENELHIFYVCLLGNILILEGIHKNYTVLIFFLYLSRV